ncbi:hypothetical protein EJD97_012874 [Solanum chilense]|uniref:Uncharacterized protein n=1 Tax=Solanum chilense TaxID=4083 RepID=A0A6N2BET1_SOLCI|nr:hypothetical protein EJD97_012874 [Solanum chilense]
MLSFTFEMIFMVSSNSHIIFCFCNFIIVILLVSGFQSSSQDNTINILDHDMSKRKQAQCNLKAKQIHKGMNDLDYQVREMDTCVTSSQEMQIFSISSDTSTIKVLRDINQDNRSGAYGVDVRSQYHESANFNLSRHRETSFKCENVEDVSDREMDTHVTSEEMHAFSASSDISTIEVLKEVNHDNKNEAYDDAAHFQHHESANCEKSLHQDTNFKCENKEDDELRKRIEDFIEKINKGWRAEKLGICYQKSISL